MLLLTLLFPLLTVCVLYFFYKKNIETWEYALPFGVTLLSLLIGWIVIEVNETTMTSDDEFWGDLTHKVQYYEPWDEYVSQTCSYTTCDSENKCTTTYYDCSYVDEHPAEYYIVGVNGTEISVSNETYNRLSKQFQTTPIFKELNRNYHSYDGDLYEVYWDGKVETSEPITTVHTYVNKVQASSNIYNFRKFTKQEVDSIGLFDYQLNQWYGNPIYGDVKNRYYNEAKTLEYINGLFGKQYQVRYHVLLFYNKDLSYGLMQESYWKRGNKNEMNICVGLNDNNEVKWAYGFSWCDDQTYTKTLEKLISSQSVLNLKEFNEYVINNTASKWQRKHFKDFDFLKIDVPIWCYVLTYIVAILANGLVVYLKGYLNL